MHPVITHISFTFLSFPYFNGWLIKLAIKIKTHKQFIWNALQLCLPGGTFSWFATFILFGHIHLLSTTTQAFALFTPHYVSILKSIISNILFQKDASAKMVLRSKFHLIHHRVSICLNLLQKFSFSLGI